MHNGRFDTLEDAIDFYDRGGDFDGPNKSTNFVRNLSLTTGEKSDLLAFLRSMTDPRVAAEQGPLFDRPMLYSESVRVPQVEAAEAGLPQTVALEPPIVGNPNFTVGVFGTHGGAEATLVIDRQDPGATGRIPPAGELAHTTITLGGEGREGGFGSVNVAIPNDVALVGETFIGRWYVRSGTLVEIVEAGAPFRFTIFGPSNPMAEVSAFAGVSAASLAMGVVAPGSIVSGFGSGLAGVTQTAPALPLPTTLEGVSVIVRDSLGAVRLAELFFVSEGQINYLVPPETAPGEAIVSALRGGSIIAAGNLQVAPSAPTLFAANANGAGPAAALLLIVAADGSQTFSPIAEFDAERNTFVATPLELGSESFLLLFGTGVRGAEEITATVGGRPAEVQFAGPQKEFPGLDQVNVVLDSSVTGEVEITISDGERTSNPVTARFQ